MNPRIIFLSVALSVICLSPTYGQQNPQGDQGYLSFKNYHLSNLNLYVVQPGEPAKYGGSLNFNYQGNVTNVPALFSSLIIPIQNKSFEEVAAIVHDPAPEIRKLFKEDDEFIKRFDEHR